MTIIDKILLVGGVSAILSPFVVFATAMIMDAIYSYFDDKWVNEGEKERRQKQC